MRVLAVAAHPDDETLGCGGTLFKHKASNDSLYWMIATVPHEPMWSSEVIERKKLEVERVAQAYGMEGVFKLGFPTTMLDVTPQAQVMQRVSEVLAEVRPAEVVKSNETVGIGNL